MISNRKRGQASKGWIAQFHPGDVVVDMDKEPEPHTNRGQVEKVLDDGLVRVLWKDGTLNDRPAMKLAKVGPVESYHKPNPAKRKALWDKILQMSDEEMDAEIERLNRLLKLN